MNSTEMIINSLPVPTWNHLGMNRTKVSADFTDCRPSVPDAEGGMPPAPLLFPERFADIETGSGIPFEKLFGQDDAFIRCISAPEAAAPETELLTFRYKNGVSGADCICVELREASRAVVLMDFCSDPDAAGSAVVQTRLRVGKDAKVTLIQLERMGSGFTFFNDIGAVLEKNADMELIRLVVSGKEAYQGCSIRLQGDESRFMSRTGYIRSGAELLDINTVVRHFGRKTQSDIGVFGSLRDQSQKIFRGTIDFVKGSSGSVGTESEEVLLLDEDTVNRTVPLILCAEEDVQGRHGASIGRPDEEKLFYLASRGIDEKEAYKLLSQAKLDAAAGEVKDETARRYIAQVLGRESK